MDVLEAGVEPKYMHAVNGRLRVRLSGMRGELRRAVEIRQRVRELEGVRSVDVKPLTGSVLVKYDPGVLEPVQILNAMGLMPPAVEQRTTAYRERRKLKGSDLKVKDVVMSKALEMATERMLRALI